MKINFRQGIVSFQSGGFLQLNSGNVDILATNRSVTVSIAHRDTDYTHSEDNYIAAAWVGPFTLPNYYLYWDFNPLTFERTFGWTTLEPVAQSVPPGYGRSPIVGVVQGVASPIAFGSFEVEGQFVWSAGKQIAVHDSTANDGVYTVQSATYDIITGNTTVLVNEAVVDGTIDGELTTDVDASGQPLFQDGRCWYDTAHNIHYELIGGAWVEILRVFAAQLFNGNTFISLSQTGNFDGTQIGNNNTVASGRVLFTEQSGDPMRRDDGTFFTTEDQFFTNQSRVDALRLESNVSRAQSISGGTLAAFGVVAWTDDGQIASATYENVGETVVGVLTENLNYLEVGAVIVQGTITNPAWTWTEGAGAVPVGSELWVNNGALVTTDPHLSDPITYPNKQVPVARVLSVDTIIFEQGLGGIGPQGPEGTVTNLPVATAGQLGMVSLSQAAADPQNPIVVGINNSVIQGAPYSPETHFHSASQTTFTPITNVISSNVQSAIAELLSRAGGVMSGTLTLNASPTAPFDAATKAYVDSIASGLDAKEACVVGTLIDLSASYNASGGTGGEGSFSSADTASLDGVFGVDYELAVTSRVLVKDQIDAKQNGIYVVTALGAGSPPATIDMERSEDFDHNDEIRAGNYTVLRSGLSQAGQGWVLTDIHPTDDIELNAHDINWTLVSAAVAYFGDPNTINIDGSNVISVIPAASGGLVDAKYWDGETISVGGSPIDGQVLTYNAGVWENADFSGLCDLTVTCLPGSDTITSTKDVFALNINTDTGVAVSAVAVPASGFDISSFAAAPAQTFDPEAIAGPGSGGNVDKTTGAYVSPDGTILIYLDAQSSSTLWCHKHILSTPFDLSSADGGTEDFTLANPDGSFGPRKIIFRQDGLKFIVSLSERLQEWTCSSPWEVTNVAAQPTYVATDDTFNTAFVGNISHIHVNNDGIHSSGVNQTAANCVTTKMVTPWDVTTNAAYQTFEYEPDIGVQALTNAVCFFAADGSKFFFSVDSAEFSPVDVETRLYEWTLGTPFDLTTTTYAGFVDRVHETETTGKFFFTDDGAHMYFHSADTPDYIYHYITGTAGSAGLTTATLYHDNVAKLGTSSTGVELFSGANKVALNAPTLASDTVFTLPATNGTNADVLSTNGSGVTSWSTLSLGDVNNNWMTGNYGGDFTAPYGLPYAGYNAFSAGYGAYAGNDQTLALGHYAGAFGYQSFAGGFSALAEGDYSIALGHAAQTTATENYGAVAIGQNVTSSGIGAITIGKNSNCDSDSGIVIGESIGSGAYSNYAVQIGRNTYADNVRQVVIGNDLTAATTGIADANNTVKIGNAAGGTETNFIYLHDSGKLETRGSLAQIIFPNYVTGSIPATTDAGGTIYDSTTKTLKFNDGTNWIPVQSGTPASTKPLYEKIVVSGSPPSSVVNTTVPTAASAGSPIMTGTIQVFRNGLLQEEDIDGGSPLEGDFYVSGANQITFTPASLFDGGVIIIYSFV